MLKITGIRHQTGEMNGKPWENYLITTKVPDGDGDGEFNAIVFKLNKLAYEDTIHFNFGVKPDKWFGMFIDENETKKHTNKYGQVMYLRLYEKEQ